MTTTRVLAALTAALLLGLAPAASAFDAQQTFKRGSFVLSPEAGYGEQFDLEGKSGFTGLEFYNLGVRFGWLPFSPVGPGPLHGSLEVGLEPFYQRYFEPVDAFFAGVGATARYHFLALGRLVPYAELGAFAGGTDLKIKEIRSDFTFLLWGGAGASFFVTDRTAVYGGYRYQHVSNGNTDRPNRGFESHTGVLGVSLFFE
jgi:opacity protein-like surface antigen